MHQFIRKAPTLVAALIVPAVLAAQTPSQRPPAFPTTVTDVTGPALSGAIPLQPPVRGAPPEQWSRLSADELWVRNVVDPALVPILPDPARATGAAAVVGAGGRFRLLSADDEGSA